MEPEKIDALFRQKMENFQKMPSADAWAKLQSRIEPPKKEEKKVMWLYYVAASVMLVLVSGVLWLTNRNENGTGTQLAKTEKTEIKQITGPDAEMDQTEKEAVIAQIQKGNSTGTENITAEKADLTKQNNQGQQLATIRTKSVKTPENKANKVVLEKAPESALAANQPKQNNTEKLGDDKMLAVNPVTTTTKAAVESVKKESLEILIIKDASETEMVAANTAPAEPETKGQSKLLLAKNIGKQLLNLKRGEKIDRTELGLPENYSIAFETQILKQKISKSINL